MKGVELVLEASRDLYSSVTEDLSQQSAKKYNDDKMTLSELDKWRRKSLPNTLKTRYSSEEHCWITKDELVLLMDWKLAKGKFRPTLPPLIKSNPSESVEDITNEGFKIILDFFGTIKSPERFWSDLNSTTKQQYLKTIKDACSVFCKLRGVGPATASLICSLTASINSHLSPPFFSDECFIYYVLDPLRPDTKIKYTIKEYIDELLALFTDILKSSEIEITMNDLEAGGWSLKMYDIYKFDKLSDIKLPKTLEKAEGQFPSLDVERITVESSRKKRKIN